MEIEFRKADKNDVLLIHQLANKIWKKHYPSIISVQQIDYMLDKMYSKESIINQMNEGHEFTFILQNGEAFGYISLSKKSESNYLLHKFYVDVEKHRLGMGGKLFDYVISHLPKNISIELTVNRQNYKAINFYFKNGFIIKEIADFDIGKGFVMNDFVMVRK